MIIGTRVFLCRNFEHLRQTKDLAQCFVSGHDLTGYEKTPSWVGPGFSPDINRASSLAFRP